MSVQRMQVFRGDCLGVVRALDTASVDTESGSTVVACLQTSRRFVGIELDPAYYEIARRRCDEARATNLSPTGTPSPLSPRDAEG